VSARVELVRTAQLHSPGQPRAALPRAARKAPAAKLPRSA